MSGIITQGMRALLFIDAIAYITRVDSKNEVIHGVSVRWLRESKRLLCKEQRQSLKRLQKLR